MLVIQSDPAAIANSTASVDMFNKHLTEISVKNQLHKLREQQRLIPGLMAGIAAAAGGAGLWAAITVITGYQIGWMAIGVGFLVGSAIRISGNGIDRIFGWMGAALALLGCLAGNITATSSLVSHLESIPFLSLVINMTPKLAFKLIRINFDLTDFIFYVLAVYEGYRFAFRRLDRVDLSQSGY